MHHFSVHYEHNPWPILYDCIQLADEMIMYIDGLRSDNTIPTRHWVIYSGLIDVVRYCLDNLRYVARNMVHSVGHFYPDLYQLTVAENFEFYHQVLEANRYHFTVYREFELSLMGEVFDRAIEPLYDFQLPF